MLYPSEAPSATVWRVLSIDDDPEIHDTYTSILADENSQRLNEVIDALESMGVDRAQRQEATLFRLDHAMGGEEGYHKVIAAREAGEPYSIILLDMRMPSGWDGLKTAEKIRSVDWDVRIVLITAYMDYDLEEVRSRIGLNFEFLKKPVDHNELIQLTLSLGNSWSERQQLLEARRYLEQAQQTLKQKVQQQTEALLSSQAETRQVLEEMNEGLIVVDQSGVIERINPKIEQMSGRGREDLVGQPLHMLFNDAPLPLTNGQHFILKEGGDAVPVDIRVSLLRSSELEERRTMLMVHDLADQLRAEEAERVSQAKDQFIASISHELRTPLTAIIGNSEMLSDVMESEPDSEQSKMLRSIEISGRTQLALVNDILDLSKIEAGKFEISHTEFDLHTLLDEIWHIFHHKAEEVGLEFEIEQPELSHQLRGDGRRVAQILINLLSNALKFTEQGRVQLKVWVNQKQTKIHFLVEDSGIGMPSEVVERLFKPFEQANRATSARFGGTGLGLHISNTLAGLMGGEIGVESEVGQGSRFQLTLPFELSDQAVLQGGNEGSDAAHYFSGSVLVVEDTPELQMLECRLLRASGVDVTVVSNGREAISMALAQPFDLILMDMQMPEMDGIEATEVLRKVGVETPVVALTANVMQKHREQFSEAGGDDFLSKPIDRNALRDVLLRYLDVDSAQQRQEPETVNGILDPELMVLFVERTKIHLEQLEGALTKQLWEEIRTISHTVKGTGSTFGFPELTELGHQVMQLIDQQQFETVAPQVEQLIAAMEQVSSLSVVEAK